MAEHSTGTEYTPATLFELADAGFTEFASVLADPDARKDYETRARHGLAVELALAWGVAAFAAGNHAAARRHWREATRLAPNDRAIPRILEAVADDDGVAGPDAESRAAARAELARVRNNSAFPHRLVRFATALAAEPEDITPAALAAARDALEDDVREAPRSYAMVLPVVRGHYPAVYSLDRAFLDATASVLADHGTRAEYERKKARRPKAPPVEAQRQPGAPHLDPAPDVPLVLPPLRLPNRRWVWPSMPRPRLAVRVPNTGYAWVGAVLGAVFFLRDGIVAMVCAAVVGFLLAWAVYVMANRP